MRKKLLSFFLVLGICFFLTPLLLYTIINSNSFDEFNLFYSKEAYISAYYAICTLGLLLFYFSKAIHLLLRKVLNSSPIMTAELLSIEKTDIKSIDLGLLEVGIGFKESYTIKFKHKNKLIDITIPKEHIERDLTKEEHPYVEYQHVKLALLFSKFHNIKVHTKDKGI
ncbi:MAG: hypothetical protein Q8936_01075 [Bacillota bacterium]|nr:hypothetical protein [Bacillota bacterium]